MRRFRICYVDDNSEICNIKTTYVRIEKGENKTVVLTY